MNIIYNLTFDKCTIYVHDNNTTVDSSIVKTKKNKKKKERKKGENAFYLFQGNKLLEIRIQGQGHKNKYICLPPPILSPTLQQQKSSSNQN